MNKTPVQGFALNEMLITTAVIGVMGVMALGAYQWYIPKAQVDEASNLMLLEAANSTNALNKSICPNKVINGKYGQLTFSGSYVNSKGQSCPSGCKVQYAFNSNAHNQLKGKVLVGDILNNHKTALNSSTTIANRLVPGVFTNGAINPGDSCAAQSITDPKRTEGSNGGSETGIVDPSIPVNPPSGGSSGGGSTGGGDPNPSNPSNPKDSGSSTPETPATPPVPEVSVNEIPGLPVGSSRWVYVTADSNYRSSPFKNYAKRTFTFTTRGWLLDADYSTPATYVDYDLTITVNLGAAYANKPVQLVFDFQYEDIHYPGELSNWGGQKSTAVADSKGFVKSPVYYTQGTMYSYGTHDRLNVNYNNQNIHFSGIRIWPYFD